MNRTAHRSALVALLFAGLLALAPSLMAQPGGRMGRGMGGRDPMAQLDLTAEQKAQIEALRTQFQTQTEGLRSQLEALRDQMREARQSNDQARIEALRSQIDALHGQMQTYRDQMHNQVKSLLTPEQAAKLDQMRENRQGRGGRGNGEGRGGRHGGRHGDCDGSGPGNGGGRSNGQGNGQGRIQSAPGTTRIR